MRHTNIFVTGCDSNTEWQLQWFMENYRTFNDTPLVVANFGMTGATLDWLAEQDVSILNSPTIEGRGWFAKPRTMKLASRLADNWCWIDTDCQVLGDISGIFDYVVVNKLSMVEDRPWSKRRGEMWHNSGVVAGTGAPPILDRWIRDVEINPDVGDQEVLHETLRMGLNRLTYVEDLPNIYNWLRLQLLDGQDSPNKLVVHHTGRKGKDEIRRLMK